MNKEDENTNNPPNINLTPGLIGYLNDSENISKTTDGGFNWVTIQNLSPNIYDERLIDFTTESIGFCVTDSDGAYKTIDGGQSWNIIHEMDGDGESISFL